MSGQALMESLREGLEGRNLRATLKLYLWGLAVLGPESMVGFKALFLATPFLVAVLALMEHWASRLSEVPRTFGALHSDLGGTMPKLRDVLQKYSPLAETGHKAEAAPPPFDNAALQRDLKALVRHNERFFWIWVGVLIVLFVLCAVLVLRYVDQPARIQQIFAGAGISFFGVIWRIGDAWKTKMALEFTITLVGGLNENAVRSIVAVLASKIKI